MAYSIKEIATLAGVSTRTLRYYDEISLLKPAHIGSNGYRFYNRDSLLRLQQIMFFRELDVPLDVVRRIMHQPNFNPVDALEAHRKVLEQRKSRMDKLIATVDQTIASIIGEMQMAEEKIFDGFDETQYEDEARQRWGGSSEYVESQKRWTGYSKKEKEAIKEEGGRLTARMVTSNPDAKPDDEDVQTAVAEYHAYINKYFYTCDAEFMRGLAEMWVQDERFAINYERIRSGGVAFVREAVNIYCDGKE